MQSDSAAPCASAGRHAFSPFACSFEHAAAALENLPRLFFEPDGSFVWVGDGGQIEGELYDRAGRLAYVELRCRCTAEAFLAIAQCLGWPHIALQCEMIPEGRLVALERLAAEVGWPS